MPVHTRLATFVVVAATLTGGPVACSSGSAPEESTPQAPTEHGAFAQCLSEHGVPTAPGPAVDPPPGVDQDTWQQAMQECATLAPGPAG